jgi:hypothetical protein
VQLLQSIFIGWIILLSRVKADYSGDGLQASIRENTRLYIQSLLDSIRPRIAVQFLHGKACDLMKAATIIGILLIVLGIIGYATGGISFTHEKKDVDLGPVQVSHKTQDTLPLSPILSTISLVAGLGLVVVGVRAK